MPIAFGIAEYDGKINTYVLVIYSGDMPLVSIADVPEDEVVYIHIVFCFERKCKKQ